MISFSNKCCAFELSIHQRGPDFHENIKTVFNVDDNKK